MKNFTDKISYLLGLVDGLDLPVDVKHKILKTIVEILVDLGVEVQQIPSKIQYLLSGDSFKNLCELYLQDEDLDKLRSILSDKKLNTGGVEASSNQDKFTEKEVVSAVDSVYSVYQDGVICKNCGKFISRTSTRGGVLVCPNCSYYAVRPVVIDEVDFLEGLDDVDSFDSIVDDYTPPYLDQSVLHNSSTLDSETRSEQSHLLSSEETLASQSEEPITLSELTSKEFNDDEQSFDSDVSYLEFNADDEGASSISAVGFIEETFDADIEGEEVCHVDNDVSAEKIVEEEVNFVDQVCVSTIDNEYDCVDDVPYMENEEDVEEELTFQYDVVENINTDEEKEAVEEVDDDAEQLVNQDIPPYYSEDRLSLSQIKSVADNLVADFYNSEDGVDIPKSASKQFYYERRKKEPLSLDNVKQDMDEGIHLNVLNKVDVRNSDLSYDKLADAELDENKVIIDEVEDDTSSSFKESTIVDVEINEVKDVCDNNDELELREVNEDSNSSEIVSEDLDNCDDADDNSFSKSNSDKHSESEGKQSDVNTEKSETVSGIAQIFDNLMDSDIVSKKEEKRKGKIATYMDIDLSGY